MIRDINFQPQPSRSSSKPAHTELADKPNTIKNPFLNLSVEPPGQLAGRLFGHVQLSLEDMSGFTILTNQLADLGVLFENTVVLQPSNPAYPARSGNNVLIGSPRPGWLTAHFSQPVNWVSCYITAPRRTILTAFNEKDEMLAQTELSAGNLADSDSPIQPNYQLTLRVPNIHHIVVHCLGGHFTLDDLNFDFQN